MADNARVAKVVAQRHGRRSTPRAATMLNDAEMANASLPSPDPDVTDLLTKAYGLEGTAGNDCYDAGATDTEAPDHVRRATASRPRRSTSEVVQRIRQIDGRTPVTTTTTGNTATRASGGIFG